jgi:hypothetical protein
MITQVVIRDNERCIVYLLDDDDFATQREASMADYHDLKPSHFHHVIATLLDAVASMSDDECADKTNPTVQHLTFFLCSLIVSLDHRTEAHIDLLRITRHPPYVTCDFTASLNLQ